MKIKIYQINMERDLHRVKFQSYEKMQSDQETADIDASIYDRVFMGDVVCGSFFVAGDTRDEICSLNDEQLTKYAEQFAQPDEDIMPEEIESHIGFSILPW